MIAIGLKKLGTAALAALFLAGVRAGPTGSGTVPAQSTPATAVPEAPELPAAELPFGAGTSYLMGVTMLGEGDYQGALPYLQHAYRLGSDSPEIGRAYLAALLGLGLGPEALAVLDNLIRLQPRELAFHRQRIALLGELGRFDEALAVVKELRQEGVPPAGLDLVEAELLAKAGRDQEAVAACRAALARPDAPREKLFLLLGSLLERGGRKEDLSRHWQEALAELPGSRALRFRYLDFLVDGHRFADALKVARDGDALADRAPEAVAAPPARGATTWRLELVDLHLQAEQYERAAEILVALQQEAGLTLERTLLLARLLVRLDRLPESLHLLRETVRQWPASGPAHYLLGDLLAASGDLTGGEAELRRAVELAPRDPDNLVSLVRVLTMKHSRALARQEADSAVAAAREEIGRLARAATVLLHEDVPRARMILGYALRAVGDYQRAGEQFGLAAKQPQNRREALLEQALCQQEAGQPQRARESLEKLRGEYPDDPVVANSLGYLLAESGQDLARAENLIRQALEVDPENGAYLDSLGWVLFQQGDFQAAFQKLVEAANALPDDPTILEHLGRSLRALGQRVEALRVLKRALTVGGDPASLEPVIKELELPGSGP